MKVFLAALVGITVLLSASCVPKRPLIPLKPAIYGIQEPAIPGGTYEEAKRARDVLYRSQKKPAGQPGPEADFPLPGTATE